MSAYTAHKLKRIKKASVKKNIILNFSPEIAYLHRLYGVKNNENRIDLKSHTWASLIKRESELGEGGCHWLCAGHWTLNTPLWLHHTTRYIAPPYSFITPTPPPPSHPWWSCCLVARDACKVTYCCSVVVGSSHRQLLSSFVLLLFIIIIINNRTNDLSIHFLCSSSVKLYLHQANKVTMRKIYFFYSSSKSQKTYRQEGSYKSCCLVRVYHENKSTLFRKLCYNHCMWYSSYHFSLTWVSSKYFVLFTQFSFNLLYSRLHLLYTYCWVVIK